MARPRLAACRTRPSDAYFGARNAAAGDWLLACSEAGLGRFGCRLAGAETVAAVRRGQDEHPRQVPRHRHEVDSPRTLSRPAMGSVESERRLDDAETARRLPRSIELRPSGRLQPMGDGLDRRRIFRRGPSARSARQAGTSADGRRRSAARGRPPGKPNSRRRNSRRPPKVFRPRRAFGRASICPASARAAVRRCRWTDRPQRREGSAATTA